ncbi:MAG: DUF3383 domain-containing protein [Rhodanobacteraceae bacterium]
MAIPASRIANVIPSVLAAAGSALDLNGLILSENASIPSGTMLPFATAADVGAFFGLTSTEYLMSQIYFEGQNGATTTPGKLYFGAYSETPTAAFLRSGSLADMTLTQLQALTGTLTVTIDGTPNTSASINLSAATSFASAATTIEAAFTAPDFTLAYDAQLSAFVFTSNTTGAASTATYATGTLAAGLNLTQATGAVLSQGAVASTPATAMPVFAAAAGDWAGFSTTFEPVLADKEAFSAWTAVQGKRYFYAGYDTDVNALTAGNTATWLAAVIAANEDGTIGIWAANDAEGALEAAAVLGWAASQNFTQKEGRTNLAERSFSGLTPTVTTSAQASALETNGYNYYGAFATSSTQWQFFYPGSITGQYKWADSYVCQIKLNADLQDAMMTLLTSVNSIPYNAAGYSLIHAALADPINAAVNFGTIRIGIPLSASQVQQLYNAVGFDVSQPLNASGYYLDIKDAAPSTRVARQSPPMTLYYNDGGSVQALSLASVEVQ